MSTTSEPPKPTKWDNAHTLVRAAIGTIPVIGGAGAELFNWLVAAPLEKRRDEWREDIGDRVQRLADAGYVRVEDLQSNEVFISTVTKASQFALATHNQTKRESLRNAVLNSALGIEPDEALQQMFLRCIDDFTEWHIWILQVLQNPRHWFRERGKPPPQYVMTSSIMGLLRDAFPELKGQEAFVIQIQSALVAKGLIGSGSFSAMLTAKGAFGKFTNDFGDRFLRFIAEPPTRQEDKPSG